MVLFPLKIANISRITYTVVGYDIPNDPNDRYATQSFSSNKVNLNSNEAYELRLDTNKYPLNTPGSYQVDIWVKDDVGSAGQKSCIC